MNTDSTRGMMLGFPAFSTVQNKPVYSFLFFLPSLLLFSLFLSTSGRLRVYAYVIQVSNISFTHSELLKSQAYDTVLI